MSRRRVLPLIEWFPMSMGPLANALAMRYGAPLFLCGSGLREFDPHDVDIRIPLGELDIARLFGDDTDLEPPDWVSPQRRRWWREELKQSRRLARQFDLNIDLQFQTQAMFWRNDAPRLRLDSTPPWTFLAGLTDA